MTFIDTSSTPFILFVLFLSAYVGIRAERIRWLGILSGVAITMFVAALFSNLDIIPNDAPIFDMVWAYFIPLSIPLLLFKANLRKIYKESGQMLIVYLLGALGTIVGSVFSYMVVNLGPETWKVVSMFCATYIGGSVNLVSVSHALDLQDKSLFLSGNAADNLVMAFYFMIMGIMGSSIKLVQYFGTKNGQSYSNLNKNESAEPLKFELILESTLLALILSVSFFCIALVVKNILNIKGIEIMVVTLLTLLFANFLPKIAQKLYDSEIIARIFMMIFFAVIGASCDLMLVLKTAPLMFVMTLSIVFFQLTFALTGAKIFKVGLHETLIACNANAGGPATAAAMASSNRWDHLVVPGILCGTLGYGVGTFVGIFLSYALRSF